MKSPTAHRRTLDNQLQTVIVPLPHLHAVSINCLIRAGSIYETAQTNGLGHLAEHMVFRGTEKRPSTFALNDAIERLGATLDGSTQADVTEYELTLPPENVTEGLELLADVMQQPLLDGIETEQRIIREEILEDLNDDGVQTDVDNVCREVMFQSHPLARPIAGTIQTLESFTKDDVRSHLHAHYTAPNMVLSVAGAVDLTSIETSIAKLFGGVRDALKFDAQPFSPHAQPERFRHVEDTDSQTNMRLSFHCDGARSPDLWALRLLDRIIDDGLSSRLHQRICDELGLAYEVFSSLDVYEHCGVFEIGAAVDHEKALPLAEAARVLLSELVDSPVSESELDKAKARYLWDLRASIDDAESVAACFGSWALFDLDRSYEMCARLTSSVTADDIQRVATQVFGPSDAHLTTVGVQSDSNRSALQQLVAG